MKNCQICGNQNSDDMRFCLNCGKPLPDAPMVFNLQDSGSQGGQPSSPGTNPYGKSMETQFGKPATFQQPQQNYSMVPPAKSGGGSKKIFIAVGGVVALFLLVLVAVGVIVGVNMMKKKEVVSTSPTPTSSPTASPSASPSSSKSASPTPKPTDSTSSTTTNFDDVKVTFKKVSVDYNKTEAGEMGMWIHVKFEVTKMKDVNSYVIVNFQKSDGTALSNGTGEYQSKDGNVAAKKALKPGFDPTVYEDLQIFMPYAKLNLSPGKYDLKMDIDLADGDQGLIKHLTFNEFKYEKQP